ncbi:phage tail protein [Xenorhabdus miraniensis]|uniref:Tail protein n=1 Tax=Xenorhabdus miraniensis TaxID=351674 RepID=A0A2D0JQD8_9GAMM|nr:phage tail protein [Xenorhabdus miraniensis]PHM48492.1 tail protein [Xenorhabdus miraniensis]
MSTKHFALLTHAGKNKLEAASSSGNKLEITHMAVGDGGGSAPIPNANQSTLINEKHRAELDALTIDPQNPSQLIAEQTLPEGEGNWWIREMGLFDKDGTLIAVGNCADLYKQESQEQTIRMALPVGDRRLTDWISKLLSGLSTRNYVREKIKEHAESRNHPNATLKEKGFVVLSSAVNSDNETHAATPKAIKTAYELANKAYDLATTISSTGKFVPSTRKVNGKELSRDIELTAANVGAYDKIQTDSLVNGANELANQAIDIANNKVPQSRKINGKELIKDIDLTALDVGAYTRQETDGLIDTVKKSADTANQNAIQALTEIKSAVPQTRKINDKELITDIQLTVDDIGTYDKKAIDDRINAVQQSADTANNNAISAIKEADKKVPLTRKINDKELLTDIQLTAADVGAYNKAESDANLKGVRDLADSKVPLTRKVNGKELTTDIQLTAVDIDVYGKAEIDTRINDVKELADNKVPSTRKVNHKELSADIQLTAADVDAYNKSEIDTRINDVQNSADNKVPSTRKVNSKELSADIQLTAADIGAYSTAEIDTRINDVQDLADSKVPLTRKVNDKELSADIQLTAADVGAYSKVESDANIKVVADLADSKVPLTRKVNNKELSVDIQLLAADVDAYSKAESDANIKVVTDLADSKVPSTRKVNDKELSADIQLTAADIGAYSTAEIDTRIKDVQDSANNKVPLTRKVNDKELSADIQLTAADVGAYSKVETDAHINDVRDLANSKVPLTRKVNNKELSADIQLTAADVDAYSKAESDANIKVVTDLADSKVPPTRKVNDKELSADIQLTAADVGAYSKAESDAHIKDVRDLANSKVPLTRKVNGKDLTTDIQLTAVDIDVYSKAEIDTRINDVQSSADGKVPLTRKVNNKELSADIQLIAADVDAYSKSEIDTRIKDVTDLGDSKVPLTRKINGKELSTDIQLIAADVDAYSKTESDTNLKDVKDLAETANKNATLALQQSVPSTRKVNGKELITDIELKAADINTYDKAEIDDQISRVTEQAKKADNTANSAISIADSKVPLTRKVNGKELSTDIQLTASDIDTYNKADINILIDEVKELANNANNNTESKVPLTRTVNGKALLSDIKLTASDMNAYTKGEVDNRIEDIKDLANAANNNADGRVPLTRTVNGKALLSDIRLTASDVGAYSKTEIDTRINKVETLASNADTNAIAAKNDVEGRLEKSKNGADIPDKQAFVRNLGLGDLVGSGLESRRIGEDHTIIKLGEIFMLNGLVVGSEPIGEFNVSVIGGVTYYTHFYKITLPTALPNGIISCQASIVGDSFDNQHPSYLADVKTRRDNSDGVGLSKDTLTVSVTTNQLDWVPHFYYQVVGY